MEKVRFGIIGMGNIGRFHADLLRSNEIARAELVAVCSRSRPLDAYRPLATYTDANALIRSGAIDAVIIATPHPTHTPVAIAAFEAGLHVLVEKPLAAHKADAEVMITAYARYPRLVFGVMLQMRAEPRYQKIRQLIQSGALGELVRVHWVNTDWYRPEAYYKSSAWRATWRGEGGGVLINQSLHNLDILQWLCGMPKRVSGFCQFGRFHQIEVEDNVTAYFEWPNNTTGVFVTSTGEAPGINRLELVGSLGTVVMENDKLALYQNEIDMVQFSHTAPQCFAKPRTKTLDIHITRAPNPHGIILQNFVNAVLDGEPLIAPGTDGIQSVELANAIVYSALLGRAIDLPLDGKAWAARLDELIACSTRQKEVTPSDSSDFTSSFRA